MADSSSLKRSEGTGGVERPVKRSRIDIEPDDAEDDENSYAAEDSGPSDLYLDTVCSLLTRRMPSVLTPPLQQD